MKKMKHFFYGLFRDLVDQVWTIVALLIGWVLLEGSARDVVGMLIWITLAVWIVTYPTRHEPLEEDEELPRDGDGDGYIYDGTPKQRKAPKKK